MAKDEDADIAAMKKNLLAKKKLKQKRAYLSTGSTMLNLGISDRVDGGFIKGGFHWLVGDSDTGKTFLVMTCLAEAARNPAFDDYRFIFDNAENGALMDIEKFFGKRVARRLEPPAMKNGQPHNSEDIDELYMHLHLAAKAGRPYIYILDSFDALSSKQEQKKHQERIAAMVKGVEAKGEMTDGKAKRNSSGLRQACADLRRTGSMLIGISQVRDNMGDSFEEQRASGGRAPKFYAQVQLWTNPRGKLKKTVKGKERELGIRVLIQVRKNRISGKKRDCYVPIYHSVGIDDLGSMVDYLIDEGHWQKPKDSQRIKAPDWQFEGTREKLIATIEADNREDELRQLVQAVWDEIEAACVVPRKPRYQ